MQAALDGGLASGGGLERSPHGGQPASAAAYEAAGSGGHQTQVAGLSTLLCLKAGWDLGARVWKVERGGSV